MKQVKKIFTLLTSLGLLLFAACTQKTETVEIKLRYTQTPEPYVYVGLPLDGNFFNGNYQKYPLTKENSYENKFTLDKAGIVSIYNNFSPIYLYVVGGEQFDITVNENAWTITGPNAEGQQLYNALFKEDTRERYAELNSLPSASERANRCNQLKEKDIQKFKALLSEKKISPKFYDFIAQEANAYYTLLLTTNIYFEYQASKYPEGEVKSVYNKEFQQVWTSALQGMNEAYSPFLKSRFSPDLFRRYYALLESEGKVKDVTKELPLPPIYNLFVIEQFQKVAKGTTLEYIWASEIVEGIQGDQYEKEWIDNFASFKKTFPNSKLIPELSVIVKQIEEYYQNAVDNNKIVFVADYQKLNSFEDVIKAVKGKLTYIDLWATWCGPCRAELQYSIANHHEMAKANVQLLYISIDKVHADTKWREMIYGLKLEGLHLRTNESLLADLNKKIPNFDGIPRYIILDADGKVVEWDAKRPSHQTELFEQLEKYSTHP